VFCIDFEEFDDDDDGEDDDDDDDVMPALAALNTA
jgi:hypothetical protein